MMKIILLILYNPVFQPHSIKRYVGKVISRRNIFDLINYINSQKEQGEFDDKCPRADLVNLRNFCSAVLEKIEKIKNQ